MQIEGQAALVTGGASGLGLATGGDAGGGGARVALLDQDEAGRRGGRARLGGLGLACDVADAASAERAVATAQEAHGPRASWSTAPASRRRRGSSGAAGRCRSPTSPA